MAKKPIHKLEKTIPERAARATKDAYKAAINSGRTVLIAKNGQLIKIHPDMRREVLKVIPKGLPVKKGTRIKIA